MSFKIFDIEFESKESIKEGNKKMDLVCQKVGQKFIKEWIEYWIEKGKIDRDGVGFYKCLKVLEDSDFSKMRKED